jgi:uncharacterized protein (TIGR02996 family)
MTTREGFVCSIAEEPDDDTHRLVYADWLDEHEEPERAELIRVQCELTAAACDAHDDPDGPRLAALTKREGELLKANTEKWFGPVYDHRLGPGFSRGMARLSTVYPLAFFTKQFQADAAEWFPRAGVIDFGFSGETKRLETLMASPLLSWLARLSLYLVRLDGREIDRLASCPHLGGLSRLSLSDARLTDKELRRLARSESLPRLRSLSLRNNEKVTPGGIATLLEGDAFPHLTSLDLPHSFSIRSVEQLRALAGTAGWQRLRKLMLAGSRFPMGSFAAFARGLDLPELTDLTLASAQPYGDELVTLTEAPNLRNLQRLDLSDNPVSPTAARVLLDSSSWPALTELRLRATGLGDAGMHALASSSRLARLTALDLSRNNISDEGLRALLASPHAANLRLLDLSGNPLSEAGFLALAAADTLPELRVLTLSEYFGTTDCSALTREVAQALVETKRFPRLTRLSALHWKMSAPVRGVLEQGLAGRVLLSR